MSRQPSYPKDAAVGDPAAESRDPAPEPGPEDSKRKKIVAGAAIGIGSAAIVAALLYARKRKTDR